MAATVFRRGASGLDGLIAASLLVAAAITLERLVANVRLLPALGGQAIVLLIVAGMLYILAHICRAMRLYLFLTGGLIGSSVPFLPLLGFQASLSLLTFGMPWKLGDGVRVAELFRLSGNDLRAVYALWFDRLADSVLIVGVLGVLVAIHVAVPASVGLLAVTAGFLLASLALLVVAPSALSGVCRACVSATSKMTLRILRATVLARKLLERIPQLDRGALSLVAVLTFAIWCLEILAISLVAAALAARQSAAPERFVVILARLFQGGVPMTSEGAVYYLVACCSLLVLMAATIIPYLRCRLGALRQGRATRSYAQAVVFGVRAAPRGRIR